MFDINFFKKIDFDRNKILSEIDNKILYGKLEDYRDENPYIFNLETTNICNMKCVMCPRTKLMKRKIEVMDMTLFNDIVSQIKPHSQEDIDIFIKYIQDKYGINQEDRNENSFYFYIISTHLVLHGYGEPVLDPYIVERVKLCSDKKILTYFSCVPANIDLNQIQALMDSGLGVIKFAIDSLTDDEQKRIRGDNNNFKQAFEKIKQVINIKEKYNYKTKIVVTMLDLSNEKKTVQKFLDLWDENSVFAYVKSQDNRWLYEEEESIENKSHYRQQYCDFPWTSLSVMVDGSVVPCTQDYNCEMSFGNVSKNSLKTIWNNEKYIDFRREHLSAKDNSPLKCFSRCDIDMFCQKRNKFKI